MSRYTRSQMMMEMAWSASRRSTCTRKHVGAVIASEGRTISIGYAGSPPGEPHCDEAGCIIGPDGGCIRTQHAEANAIVFAARKGVAIEGATLYCTDSPCVACAKLILTAGLQVVIYDREYRITDGIELLQRRGVVVLQSLDIFEYERKESRVSELRAAPGREDCVPVGYRSEESSGDDSRGSSGS